MQTGIALTQIDFGIAGKVPDIAAHQSADSNNKPWPRQPNQDDNRYRENVKRQSNREPQCRPQLSADDREAAPANVGDLSPQEA